ncbi:anthranilate phosphoribosyltransferase [Quaeritorhiza haematococci]|nr:anthranilate phosphoribosyltransferase [Quaeritorhiza haematococci]
MIVGVHSKELGKLMAEALALTGVKRAWVVSGAIGLDEISPEGLTYVWSLEEDGQIIEKTISASDFGLKEHPLSAVVGGDPSYNGRQMQQLLNAELKEGEPIMDFVLMNAGALLHVSGKAGTLREGVELAKKSIVEGKAKKALESFAAMSRGEEGA